MQHARAQNVLPVLGLLLGWVLILPLGSFLIDPFLLVALGALIVYVSVKPLAERFKARTFVVVLYAATLAIFYVCSISLYLDLAWIAWMWKLCGAESGLDFMLNSGVLHFDYTAPTVLTHVIAVVLFALYPLWLYLGICLGRRMWDTGTRETRD